MGDYYNATRGPLSASLVDGSALSIGPKKWIFIHPEQENSSSIVKLLDKGFLVRAKVPKTKLPEPVVANAAISAAPAKAPEKAPEKDIAPASGSTSSMKEEIFRKKK